GVLSYVLDGAPEAIRELRRVTRPGGHVLVSVMALVGATVGSFDRVLEYADTHGPDEVRAVTGSGLLPSGASGGHLPMRMYRWRELEELLGEAGAAVAARAGGLLPGAPEGRAGGRAPGARALGAEPGALDAGAHILAVIRL